MIYSVKQGAYLAEIKIMKIKYYLILLFFVPVLLSADLMHSPTWGFRIYLPIGYEYIEGNGIDRFSFQGPSDSKFDMLVYNLTYPGIDEMVQDISRRLGNTGDTSFFEYRGKNAAIMELRFAGMEGWALALELDSKTAGGKSPLLLALAYAPVGTDNIDLFHISALNSIAPTTAEMRKPGPVMEFAYPRGQLRETQLAGGLGSVMIRENDADAAQALVEQEFLLLTMYQDAPFWQEAWIRFYRAIYRDSWDRITNAASQIARNLNSGSGAANALPFAQRALTFVQGFKYERNFDGSDFVNLVTAVTEGRGDCDSRAMLWAIILAHTNIQAGIMLSPYYSHAMGIVNIPGPGARFEAAGVRWLVAETTANVNIGLIAADQSNPEYWMAVTFE